jgi:hypothetical protein
MAEDARGGGGRRVMFVCPFASSWTAVHDDVLDRALWAAEQGWEIGFVNWPEGVCTPPAGASNGSCPGDASWGPLVAAVPELGTAQAIVCAPGVPLLCPQGVPGRRPGVIALGATSFSQAPGVAVSVVPGHGVGFVCPTWPSRALHEALGTVGGDWVGLSPTAGGPTHGQGKLNLWMSVDGDCASAAPPGNFVVVHPSPLLHEQLSAAQGIVLACGEPTVRAAGADSVCLALTVFRALAVATVLRLPAVIVASKDVASFLTHCCALSPFPAQTGGFVFVDRVEEAKDALQRLQSSVTGPVVSTKTWDYEAGARKAWCTLLRDVVVHDGDAVPPDVVVVASKWGDVHPTRPADRGTATGARSVAALMARCRCRLFVVATLGVSGVVDPCEWLLPRLVACPLGGTADAVRHVVACRPPVCAVAWLQGSPDDDDSQMLASDVASVRQAVPGTCKLSMVFVGDSVRGVPSAESPCLPAVDTLCLPAVDTPCLPAVDTPCLPAVDTPCLPAVDTLCLPAVDTPCLPAVDMPCLPAVDTPCLPAVDTLCLPSVQWLHWATTAASVTGARLPALTITPFSMQSRCLKVDGPRHKAHRGCGATLLALVWNDAVGVRLVHALQTARALLASDAFRAWEPVQVLIVLADSGVPFNGTATYASVLQLSRDVRRCVELTNAPLTAAELVALGSAADAVLCMDGAMPRSALHEMLSVGCPAVLWSSCDAVEGANVLGWQVSSWGALQEWFVHAHRAPADVRAKRHFVRAFYKDIHSVRSSAAALVAGCLPKQVQQDLQLSRQRQRSAVPVDVTGCSWPPLHPATIGRYGPYSEGPLLLKAHMPCSGIALRGTPSFKGRRAVRACAEAQ